MEIYRSAVQKMLEMSLLDSDPAFSFSDVHSLSPIVFKHMRNSFARDLWKGNVKPSSFSKGTIVDVSSDFDDGLPGVLSGVILAVNNHIRELREDEDDYDPFSKKLLDDIHSDVSNFTFLGPDGERKHESVVPQDVKDDAIIVLIECVNDFLWSCASFKNVVYAAGVVYSEIMKIQPYYAYNHATAQIAANILLFRYADVVVYLNISETAFNSSLSTIASPNLIKPVADDVWTSVREMYAYCTFLDAFAELKAEEEKEKLLINHHE